MPSVTSRVFTQPRRSETVDATRSTPSYSDIAYWLSSMPGTSPDPRYVLAPDAAVTNLCTLVVAGVPSRLHSVVET